MTSEEFLSNDEDTNFIDRVCAFLEISTDKLKIVGVQNSGGGRLRGRLLADVVMSLNLMLDGGRIGGEEGDSTYKATDEYLKLKSQVAKMVTGL